MPKQQQLNEVTMIKFYDDKIFYSKQVKTNKHKKLLLHFTIDNDYYFKQSKEIFKTWQKHILECCQNVEFKNNIVTEKYFRN